MVHFTLSFKLWFLATDGEEKNVRGLSLDGEVSASSEQY